MKIATKVFFIVFCSLSLRAGIKEVKHVEQTFQEKYFGGKPQPDTLSECRVNGMVGIQPVEACILAKKLLSLNAGNATKDEKKSENILFNGPSGIGKTTLFNQLAKETNCELEYIKGSTIVTQYLGQGAQTIESVFKKAKETVLEQNRVVIIFIDEIDQIGKSNTTEMRSEHDSAMRTLWLNMDDVKDNPYIWLVGATNEMHNVHQTLLNRFSKTIEGKKIDLETRKEFIRDFFKKKSYEIQEIDVQNAAQETQDFNFRDIIKVINNCIDKQEYAGKELTSKAFLVEIQIEKKMKAQLKKKKEDEEQEKNTPKESWYRQFYYIGVPSVALCGVFKDEIKSFANDKVIPAAKEIINKFF